MALKPFNQALNKTLPNTFCAPEPAKNFIFSFIQLLNFFDIIITYQFPESKKESKDSFSLIPDP